MERRILRPLRRDYSRRSLLYRDTGRAEQKMALLGSLYPTLRVETAPWIKETITKKLKELIRDCEEHGEDNTRLHPKDTVTEEGSERVDPKTGWRWYDHPSTSSSSSSWQAASWWKSSSWKVSDFFLRTQGVFAHRQWRFPCERRSVCAQDTKPARSVTFPHTVFFSRGVFC